MNFLSINFLKLLLIFFLFNILFVTAPQKLLVQFILIYFSLFALLLWLEVNFLALTFFIVYIGAVAILFLFTVLLLGKSLETSTTSLQKINFNNSWKDWSTFNSILIFYKFNSLWVNTFKKVNSDLFTINLPENEILLKSLDASCFLKNYEYDFSRQESFDAFFISYTEYIKSRDSISNFHKLDKNSILSDFFYSNTSLTNFLNKNLLESLLQDVYILSLNLYDNFFLLFFLSGCLLLIAMLAVVGLIIPGQGKKK